MSLLVKQKEPTIPQGTIGSVALMNFRGIGRNRTHDIRTTKPMFCQLNYYTVKTNKADKCALASIGSVALD